MNSNKFRAEKILHEVIRDLPEAQKIEKALERGIITPLAALRCIVGAWEEELEKTATATNANRDN